jgi:predicted transcriptional regulator YdeE
MDPKFMKRDGFNVVGIEVRTKNEDEVSGKGKIPRLWERFFAEGILEKIPHRKPGGPVLAVYSNYESDARGPYSLLLGAEVSRVEDVPPGFVAKTVPGAEYAIFTSTKGPIPQIVHDLWRQVWAWTPEGSRGGRAYGVDFEIYDERASDPKNAQMAVFISVI